MQPYRFVEKKFSVSSETWKFAERDDIWRHSLFSRQICAGCQMQSGAIVDVDGWNGGRDDLIFVAFRASNKKGNQAGHVQQNTQFG